LIKYIKSVLWRAAKRLSNIEDARCLKVKNCCTRCEVCCRIYAINFKYLRLCLSERSAVWNSNLWGYSHNNSFGK